MAPPTAPAKTVDGGADDANLPVADVVVADETVPIAEEEPIAVAESVETIEPLAAATSTIESDAVLAQRGEQGRCHLRGSQVRQGPARIHVQMQGGAQRAVLFPSGAAR